MPLDNLLPLFGALIPSLYQARPSGVALQVLEEKDFVGSLAHSLLFALIVVLLSSIAFFVEGLSKPVELPFGATMKAVHYVIVMGIGGLASVNFVFTLIVEHAQKRKRTGYLVCIFVALAITGHILLLRPFI